MMKNKARNKAQWDYRKIGAAVSKMRGGTEQLAVTAIHIIRGPLTVVTGAASIVVGAGFEATGLGAPVGETVRRNCKG